MVEKFIHLKRIFFLFPVSIETTPEISYWSAIKMCDEHDMYKFSTLSSFDFSSLGKFLECAATFLYPQGNKGDAGDARTEWEIQGSPASLTQFNVTWHCEKDGQTQNKVISQDQRSCVLPLQRQKYVHSFHTCIMNDMIIYHILHNRSTGCFDKSPGEGYIRFREPGATVTNMIHKRNWLSKLRGASIRGVPFWG